MPSHARAVASVLLSPLGGHTMGAATPAPPEHADLGEEKWEGRRDGGEWGGGVLNPASDAEANRGDG